MTSTDIYQSDSTLPHIPYFYIIKHISSGMLYAGSCWRNGCHPSKFMTNGGYQTSSKIVNDLIDKDGLESFSIIQLIISSSCNDDVYTYESRFLQTYNIAKRDNWLNFHNNDISDVHSQAFKDAIMAKYGFEFACQSPEIKEKIRNSMLMNHGVEFPMQSLEVQAKSRSTCLNNHGVEFPMQSLDIQSKSRKSCKDIYGVEFVMQSLEVQSKSRSVMLKKYGVAFVSQLPEIKEKKRLEIIEKSSRKSVILLRILTKKHKIKLGGGWYQKSDSWINKKLESIINSYEKIDNSSSLSGNTQ